MKRALPWLGLLVTLALLLTTCGGDEALSDEAYFAALQDVGADSSARAGPLFETLRGAPPDTETALAFLDGYQALLGEARAGVAVLAAPSDLAAANDAFVDAAGAAIAALERARVRVEAGELEAVFEPAAFAEFVRACVTLEQRAADRGFELELCATGE